MNFSRLQTSLDFYHLILDSINTLSFSPSSVESYKPYYGFMWSHSLPVQSPTSLRFPVLHNQSVRIFLRSDNLSPNAPQSSPNLSLSQSLNCTFRVHFHNTCTAFLICLRCLHQLSRFPSLLLRCPAVTQFHCNPVTVAALLPRLSVRSDPVCISRKQIVSPSILGEGRN